MSDATIAAGTEQRLTAQELKAQEKAAKKTEKERLKRVARDEKASARGLRSPASRTWRTRAGARC